MCRTLPKTRASSWFRVTLPVCDRWTCVCIYKKDSEPVFLNICKQSACSQNLCSNWYNFMLETNVLLVEVCLWLWARLCTFWSWWKNDLTSLMQNEGLNTVLQSSVNSWQDLFRHRGYVYIACRAKNTWVNLRTSVLCSSLQCKSTLMVFMV